MHSFILVPIFTIFFCFVALPVSSQSGPSSWTTRPFSPPAIPLAVRSPYLNTWLPQGAGPTQLNVHTWPNFWNIENTVTSWYAHAVVDGVAYRLVGVAANPNVTVANQTAIEFTPTQTFVQFTAGPMQMNVSFLSPIEPTDLVRQSLPFAYLSISAASTDGGAHSLQMYSDISGEFITGDTSKVAQWTADESGDYVVLSMQLQTQQQFSEINSFAQDATEYYSFKHIGGTTTTWAIANDTINRTTAASLIASLGNQTDPTPRAVNTTGNNQPVLGIAVDWGTIESTPEPAVWAIGVVRSPSIQYKTASGAIQNRYPYFLSKYSDASDAARAFLDDFQRAQEAAAALDSQIITAGEQISLIYSHLLSLTARQVMASMDITLSKTGNGQWNTSDVKIFMKNLGSAGSDSMSVNAVDILYAAFPTFIYLNPELGGYLLSPLLEYQDSDAYTLSFAAKHIGSAYPNATADGINNGHIYGVEETANMIIMALAYTQASGNRTLLDMHYTMFRRWAEYLIQNSLTPTNQASADFSPLSSLSNDNQTNTALKGIIGIAAMAKIAEIMNMNDDQANYNSTSASFITQWMDRALAPDQSHINFFYDMPNTNGMIYNVYADRLLHLEFVPEIIYDVLTEFYQATSST
ncbi:DUF1793-domain-containing protein [Fomitiporia mediterranea MF3/22]|uniref:DUF1793-domain-containing protein n=1 Tax=Fomitiporia mediterranea (strain MF3/22) TaxID=694068 RepID=UPI0004407E9D|nr:DUF1793-domain-containing protein [Fomitiporia mediterranea MF3/22]EJC99891.1 DUF1793-domain-containing protein [Fomitiporia mediterranea MF3/22]